MVTVHVAVVNQINHFRACLLNDWKQRLHQVGLRNSVQASRWKSEARVRTESVFLCDPLYLRGGSPNEVVRVHRLEGLRSHDPVHFIAASYVPEERASGAERFVVRMGRNRENFHVQTV